MLTRELIQAQVGVVIRCGGEGAALCLRRNVASARAYDAGYPPTGGAPGHFLLLARSIRFRLAYFFSLGGGVR